MEKEEAKEHEVKKKVEDENTESITPIQIQNPNEIISIKEDKPTEKPEKPTIDKMDEKKVDKKPEEIPMAMEPVAALE